MVGLVDWLSFVELPRVVPDPRLCGDRDPWWLVHVVSDALSASEDLGVKDLFFLGSCSKFDEKADFRKGSEGSKATVMGDATVAAAYGGTKVLKFRSGNGSASEAPNITSAGKLLR